MKNTRDSGGSREATKGLGILLAQSATPDLVVAAHSSDSDLAREALNSLAKIKDRDSGPKLVDLLDDTLRIPFQLGVHGFKLLSRVSVRTGS